MTIKNLSFLLGICFLFSCTATKKGGKVVTPEEEILAFQEKINAVYKVVETSPLKSEAVNFKGHDFFEIDLNYRVTATFKALADEPFFTMPTTGARQPKYKKYGVLSFQLNGKYYELTVFQNEDLIKNPVYKDYLFLPFTDLTNEVTTYGGGRYIDFQIPTGETAILDFNKAYNPYCAYASGYSCPIPPAENHLDTEVKAGIKFEMKF